MTANHQRPTMLPVHDNRVYLRDPVSGMWLHLSGEHLVADKAYRWIGTPAQAKKMRLASKFATGMRIESASPSKGHSK